MKDRRIHDTISKILEDGGEAILVTVIEKLSEGPAKVGSKMLVLPGGERIGTVGGGSLELAAVRKALELMEKKKSTVVRYNLNYGGDTIDGEVRVPMVCGGKVTLFYEYISSGPSLYIFGAGNVGREVAVIASNCDFVVTVFDPDERALSMLPESVKKVKTDYLSLFEKHDFRRNSFFLVSTLSHQSDFMVLRQILRDELEAKYIGMLASVNKLREVLRLIQKHKGLSAVEPDIFYSPVGLNIGGDTPAEIAVSIVAEMQGIRYGIDGLPHKSAVREVLEELTQ